MGLDTTHDAWHGAYSAFNRWRTELARVAGLPPLELMEGFYTHLQPRKDELSIPTIYVGPDTDELTRNCIGRLDERLPIQWNCLKSSALHELLHHSDCAGEIAADRCVPIANALEKLLPLLPEGDGGGHIGHWREKTQQFVDGLRRAAAAGEPLGFH